MLIGLAGIWSGIIAIASFIQENSQTLLFLVVFILFVIVVFSILSSIRKTNQKKKVSQAYEATPYFLETKTPYQLLPTDKGNLFEIEIFNRIKNEFKNDIQLIHNLLIPKLNAVNEYSEIDLVAIHVSGIYVIEVKNYSGPVSGKDEDDYWKPYIQDTDNNNRQIYIQNYAIKGFNQYGLYNPIKQNEGHINSLNALISNIYINKVVFSNSMLIGPSLHPKIHSVDGLVEFLKKSPNKKYSAYDLDPTKDKMLSIKITDPRAINLHIVRLNRKSL